MSAPDGGPDNPPESRAPRSLRAAGSLRPPTAPTLREDLSPAREPSPAAIYPSPVSENPLSLHRLADPGERRSVGRAMLVGAFAWPSFLLTDLYSALVAYQGAPVILGPIFRVAGVLAILAVLALSRRDRVTSLALTLANAAVCAFCSSMISVLALDFGSIESPYIHGISLLIFVEALALPAPWRTTLWFALPSALSFPAVLLVASRLRPDTAAALADSHRLAVFGAHYAMLAAAVIIAAICGQLGHNARVELHKARRLGRYRLEARIGAGGMNEVWLAWDPPLSRHVALKILRTGADTPAKVLARFEREALATSRLTSPHTVRIFDYGASDDGFSYIAMEFLDGADLQQLVSEEGALPPARAVRFLLQACRSLAEAHAAGIIHRDIKPANLFATGTGEVPDVLKVVDFGIARLLEGAGNVTATQNILGTPAYLAPECWSGHEADARSDLYSLGATLFCLLTGRPPFAGKIAADLIRAHLLEAPLAPSQALAAVSRQPEAIPPSLDALVLRCLAKSPEDRYPTARALESALENVAEDLPPWTDDEAREFWLLRARATRPPASLRMAASRPAG